MQSLIEIHGGTKEIEAKSELGREIRMCGRNGRQRIRILLIGHCVEIERLLTKREQGNRIVVGNEYKSDCGRRARSWN